MASILKSGQNEPPVDFRAPRSENGVGHRRRPLRALFIHRDADAIDSCMRELEKAQFTVTADFGLDVAQCAERVQSQSYDVIVAEYPSPSWQGARSLKVLQQTLQETPLVFVTSAIESESIAELVACGAFDYVEAEHIGQLPMAVRRALNERELRAELEAAGKALRHSQSLYRALADNPTYGICRCDAQGKFLDVNRALVAMLGYDSREELLSANQGFDFVLDFGAAASPATRANEKMRIEPVEIEWKRKNGTALKVKVSGRGVYSEPGDFVGYEIIAVDVTEQRALEEHLRHQASSDSLTGLANHRRLFEVLHAEISRSKRTGREFCLLLLDLDSLKEINDQLGHLSGDRALCRLARVLEDCCRSIDTAARQGGDEFALVLPETSAVAASMVARRVRDLLAQDSEEPGLSVSFGVACCPNDADTVASLLYAADKKLYAMKDIPPRAARSGHA
ncbi:MAG TPA: diguanylate cyclase [Candidatus Acidoferrum sp.]|nr:diguanylate cyclase [Candidatus Acidoferrum sp.]